MWYNAHMLEYKQTTRSHQLPCVARALGISIIACFHISTIPQCAAQAAPVPRLAFQTYAVRDLCEKDFAGTLKAAKAMGYEGVETGRFFGLDAKGLRAACDEAGLELVALQLYPHNLTEPQLSETIRFCKDCGCNRINVAWYKGSAENPNDWQMLVNVLNHAAEVCAKEGIAVAYHNHDHEFSMRIGDKRVWDWLFAKGESDGAMRQVTDTPRFSDLVLQELDCGNCVLGGGDPVQCIARHPHRNPTVHIMPAIKANVKCKMENGKCDGCGVGSPKDMADWKRIISALVADGVELLVVKPTAHPDSLADLEASAVYLKNIADLQPCAEVGQPIDCRAKIL